MGVSDPVLVLQYIDGPDALDQPRADGTPERSRGYWHGSLAAPAFGALGHRIYYPWRTDGPHSNEGHSNLRKLKGLIFGSETMI